MIRHMNRSARLRVLLIALLAAVLILLALCLTSFSGIEQAAVAATA